MFQKKTKPQKIKKHQKILNSKNQQFKKIQKK